MQKAGDNYKKVGFISFFRMGGKRMIIPKKQMQKIVEEVGATIHKNVNIMDETGCIIASTDSERIGLLHSGAVELLENNLASIVIEKDSIGSKSGINLPLVIENKVIGVVGITGAVEEVGVLGTVIKKMTEILVWDWYTRNQKNAIETFKRSIAVEMLFGNEEDNVQERWNLLGLQIDRSRIIVVADIIVDKKTEQSKQEVFETIFTDIKRKIEQDKQQILISMGTRIIIFYNMNNVQQLLKQIKEIQKQIETSYPCNVYVGIGTPGRGRDGIKKSYKEADNACNFVKQLTNESIKVYQEKDISMLMTEIAPKKRQSYVNDVFKGCTDKEKDEIINCLKSYIKNNGSINKIAEELFIHKNTLQYRLSKIKNLTGYDPRILEEFIPLVMAMYLDELK